MAVGVASGSRVVSKLLRPQSSDLQAAAMWGVAATAGALWLIQPFGWLKKTFLEKSQPQGE